MAKRPREGLHLLEQRLTHRPQALQPGGLLGRAGLPHERMIERRGKVAQVRPKERGFLAQHPVAQPRPPGERAFLQVGGTELAEAACSPRVVLVTPVLLARAGDVLQPQPRSLAGTVACPPTSRGADPGEVCEQAGLVAAELPLPVVVGGRAVALVRFLHHLEHQRPRDTKTLVVTASHDAVDAAGDLTAPAGQRMHLPVRGDDAFAAQGAADRAGQVCFPQVRQRRTPVHRATSHRPDRDDRDASAARAAASSWHQPGSSINCGASRA